MALADHHVFMILTKRPARMREFIEWYKERSIVEGVAGVTFTSAFAHVWHGVKAENQETADERLPQLVQVPAAVRFVSVEPMLGPVNLFDSVPAVFGTLRHPP